MIAGVWPFAALAAALLLDRLVGDPPWIWRRLPHPVAFAGRVIDRLEAWMNRPEASFAARRRRGIAATALLTAGGVLLGAAVHAAAASLPFGMALEAIVVAVLLAQKSLVDHVCAVALRLGGGGTDDARQALRHIVGRDVTLLDEAGIARAAIETAAENFSDGVVAPAFWYLLLGLPGLIAFKVVNTADSMVGNRSARHEAFGWAAARLDDVLNWIPARLSALLLAAASALSGLDARGALTCAWGEARRHKSPNAGWPEAAAAGALGVALGGPRRYGETAVDGAWFNRGGRRDACPDDIRAAIRLIDTAWALLFALVCAGAGAVIVLAR